MRHVLVVDDDTAICRMLTAALEDGGRHRVTCAESLAEARARIAADPPDTVVLDVILPDGSGLDLARELARAGVPVLLIAGHPETMDEAQARGLPVVTKPFRVREFLVWLGEAEGGAAGHAEAMRRALDGPAPRV
jgi:two-component system phosphate regulon response regulator OmpR